MDLLLPADVRSRLANALEASGEKEIGGVLMGEHVGPDRFRVVDLSIQPAGSFARFVRAVGVAIRSLRSFFGRTGQDYRRFNYLGEWHSHPSFTTTPSATDRRSMQEIVDDPSVGANFAVLMIVRLGGDRTLEHSLTVFLPDASPAPGLVIFEEPTS